MRFLSAVKEVAFWVGVFLFYALVFGLTAGAAYAMGYALQAVST